MIQKKNSVLIRKKRMRIEGDRKNHEITRGCAMKRSQAMFSYFCWKSKKTNLFASSEGCTNFCPPKNKNVPQKFSQGDKLSPSDQILAQTLIIISNNLLLFNFIQGLLHVYLVNMYQVLFGICLTIIK